MDIAIGISKLEYGNVGDGVPAASFTEITDAIAEGTVSFSFSDPTETPIKSETSDTPVAVLLSKEDPEYIELALISPSAATMALLAGGTATSEKWEAPTTVPQIAKSIKLTTAAQETYKWEYTIVNAKIVAKLSQAPGKKQEERLLVRFYVQEAKTAAGVVNTPFIRERVAA